MEKYITIISTDYVKIQIQFKRWRWGGFAKRKQVLQYTHSAKTKQNKKKRKKSIDTTYEIQILVYYFNTKGNKRGKNY